MVQLRFRTEPSPLTSAAVRGHLKKCYAQYRAPDRKRLHVTCKNLVAAMLNGGVR